MKTLLLSLTFSTILLIGCANDSTFLTTPDPEFTQQPSSSNFIKLPPKKEGLSVEESFTITKTIDGSKGGQIFLKKQYAAEDGHFVKIDVKLKIKKNSFTGIKDITLTADDEYAAVWFTPHIVFNKPVTLQVTFTGIDLEELQLVNGNYDFVFIDDDGNIELVDHEGVDVKESQGQIRVQKAYLNHFSRYGFTR